MQQFRTNLGFFYLNFSSGHCPTLKGPRATDNNCTFSTIRISSLFRGSYTIAFSVFVYNCYLCEIFNSMHLFVLKSEFLTSKTYPRGGHS